jgi:2-iminobutanoate/2-iminopropanoate deaminase
LGTPTRLPRRERRNTLRALPDEEEISLSSHRESVSAPDAPAAVGPYVHAIRAGNLLFCSGQIPLDPRTGDIVGASPGAQAGRCLENLAAVCHAAGATLGDAVRLTVYLTDMSSFAEVNEVYESFFESDPPARVAIGVAALPRGALVEIDAVVALL